MINFVQSLAVYDTYCTLCFSHFSPAIPCRITSGYHQLFGGGDGKGIFRRTTIVTPHHLRRCCRPHGIGTSKWHYIAASYQYGTGRSDGRTFAGELPVIPPWQLTAFPIWSPECKGIFR